jgi:hypothetical protein
MDPVKTFLEERIAIAKTPEERELAEGLLYGYNLGELQVLTDTLTGNLLFALKNQGQGEDN